MPNVYFGDDYLEIMGKKNAIIYYRDIDGMVFNCDVSLPLEKNTTLTLKKGSKTYSLQTSMDKAKDVSIRRSRARSTTQ